MKLLRISIWPLCCAGLVFLASCAGCAEECSGPNAHAAGCPCADDQDCSAQSGDILLCQDGACRPGDPTDAPSARGSCTADGACGAGEACGVTGDCHVAPRCQRIEATTLALIDASTGSVGAVAATIDDCRNDWSLTASTGSPLVVGPVRFSIGLDGVFSFDSDPPSAPCTTGLWRAGQRVGVLVCGASKVVVTPAELTERICFDDNCASDCVVVDELESPTGADRVGVCP